MTTPYRTALPAPPRREILVDVEPESPEGVGGTTLVGLLVAVALILFFARSGSRFFFLPIIIPFGFGGGSIFRRVLGRVRPRVLRLEHSELLLVPRGRGAGPVDVGDGAYVALAPTGFWVNGVQRVELRVVGARGALSVRLLGDDRGRDLKRRLCDALREEGIPLVGDEASLAGGIAARRLGSGEEIVWTSPGGRFASVPLFFMLPLVLATLAWFVFETGAESALLLALGALGLVFAGFFAGGRRKTVLSVGPDGWSLRVHAGARLEASTGGPGRLTARVVSTEALDPFGAGIAHREHALELWADGERVGVVGGELTLPELRFIEQRVGSA